MKLNEKEVKKLPKGDALCLHAYVQSLKSIKEYQDKIDTLEDPDHLAFQIFSLVKETHENYSNILLNILAQLPTIKDCIIIEKSDKKKKRKIPVKPKSK